MQPHERLILALDLPQHDAILALAKRTVGHVGMVKVGLEAYVRYGNALLEVLAELGHSIFLDLKLHDIPRTVAAVVKGIDARHIRLLTVHASGGPEMIRAARDAAPDTLDIIAVTMLTSMDDSTAKAAGFLGGIDATVRALGDMAISSGADGLVCASPDLPLLHHIGGKRVVPGIRLGHVDGDDQRRTATPVDAVRAGATWLVLGRPVLQSPDPVATLNSIAKNIADAETSSQ